MMETEEEKRIKDLASSICKDGLQRRIFKEKFENFLTNVKVPSGWEDKGYKLEPDFTTYKYRYKLLKNVIDKRKSEGFNLTRDTSKQFFDELEQFSDSDTDESFSELEQGHRTKHDIDLFEQNVKLEGVVLQKSDKRHEAFVLVKTEDRSRRIGASRFSLSELIVSLHDEGDSKSGEGFYLEVAKGDVVEVSKCRRKNGTALEPEIIKCCFLSETKLESFLSHLLSCVESNGSSATAIEITRFRAAWEYILNLSEKTYTDQMTSQILEIINKICSSVPMSHTVSEIVEGFQQSTLFRSTLPDFIAKNTEESCVSMVQKILEHVITAVPAQSCFQVLEMAKALAQNLLKGSSDLEKAKQNGQTAIDFLTNLSLIIASEMYGARTDIEALPWKKLPLIPVAEEIKKPRLKTNDLPVIRKEGKYESEEKYLDTHFRLLREECFYKLRKGISDFVEGRQKCDSKDMMMYSICLRGVSMQHEDSPTVMLISLEYELLDTRDSSESENEGQLLYGNLLCISVDGTFQAPVWAVVDKHIGHDRIVRVTLCDKANTISEPQFIQMMQGMANIDKKAFMAESQTFYVSFAPAMEVLQNRDHVPFKEFLVYPDPKNDMESADYINKIKHPPDWEIIFQKESLSDCSRKDESPVDYSLLKDFDGIRLNSSFKTTLDETQLAAVELALKNRLVLIQGPPGTGKSFVGVALVRLLLSMNVPQDHGPILVVTYKNHALNNFMTECLHKVSSPDVKIVRVGRVDEGHELKKYLLREVGRYWPPRLYEQKRKLLGQIWALQPDVREAFHNLRSSSIFNADMFLKEASEDQLKHLLVGNKNGNVTEAQVKTLVNEQTKSHKSKARLKELVENALEHWLPSQEVFDRFVAKQKKSSQGNSSVGNNQQKSRDDQDQLENPNDFKDPSVEQKERLLATDEEIADEEDKEIAKEEATPSQDPPSQDPYSVRCRNLVCFDETEVKSFKDLPDDSNVWELDDNQRVQLVYVLQSKFFSNASSEFLEVSKEYMKLHHQLKELRNQWDIEVMKKCHVIGMTVTGATMRANLLADIKPSVMIVEEAAEILEGQLVAVIPPSVQHLIMIGDHQQLKPVVYFHRLKRHHYLDLSMFERLVNCKIPFRQLGFQCRMRDEFVDLLRELKIYKELKTNHQLVKDNHSPACVESSMYFWTHTTWEGEWKASHSKRNSREAKEITEVAQIFCKEGNVPPSKITVLCSYRGQVEEIKRHFRSSKVAALDSITVTTIDSFQGQENDIILLSLVRSNKDGKIGYLSSMNRLCVAISRARCGLYLFGNNAQLAKASSKGWRIVSNFMRSKGCLGYRFPFRSNTESSFQKSQRQAESPSSSGSQMNVTIIADQANVNFGGDNSVNTVKTDSGDPPLDATPPPRTEIHLSPPKSGKMPVQDPKSPLHGYPSLTFEAGIPRLATQDARLPSQETPGKEKSIDTGEVESSKERLVQESLNPKERMHETPQTEIPNLQQLLSKEDSKAMPVQETEETKSRTSGLEDQSEDFLQKGELQENKAVVVTEDLSNKVSTDKHEGDPSGEQPFQVQDFEEFDKEKPLQETEDPGKTAGDLPEEKPLQDTFSSKVEDASSKEEVVPTQETMAAGKGPFEEAGVDEEKALQETQAPGNVQGAEDNTAKEIQENEGVLHIEDSEVKPPKQETGSSETGTSIMEEVVPTQEETMAAGKGPFEETGVDEGKALQETQGVNRMQGVDTNNTKEINKGEREDALQVEDSEVKPTKQETGSSEVETGTSMIEEVAPTQEIMAAGKGPFEETGVDKDKALQETQGVSKEMQGDDGDSAKEIEEGEGVLQIEDSEGKPLKQDTGSSEVETGTSIKEEAHPTQETVTAGKGPFEETGLEVGIKGHPTDEQGKVVPLNSPPEPTLL